MKQWHDKAWLREKYHNDGMDMNEIAEICGVTGKTIQYWFNKHDIDRNNRGTTSEGKYTDKQWLKDKYHNDCLSLRDIADICDVSKTTIRRWFDRHNIKPRAVGRSFNDDVWSDKSWLRQNYITEGKTIEELAESADTSNATIYRALLRFGIEPRSKSEYSKDPDERVDSARGRGWREQRKKALERANYTCEEPSCDKEESEKLSLHAHHIIPYRLFDEDSEANDLSNLLILCPSCHRKIEPNKILVEPMSEQ